MTYAGRLEGFMTMPTSVSASVTNNGGGPTTVNFTAGSYTITSLCTHIQSALTSQRAPSSGSWSVSVSTGSSGTGKVTISMSSGTFSITWSSTDLRDVLGFTANITSQTSSTGSNNARGLWLPDCPVTISNGGDPDSAPKTTDMRGVQSPYGVVTSYLNASFYGHDGLNYSHVARNKAWKTAESTTYESLQSWIDDTQFGAGHSWFSVGSPFLAYWSSNGSDRAIGYELNAGAGPSAGWYFSPPIVKPSDHIKQVQEPWLGIVRVSLPGIVSSG